jgi:alpha-D-ribose 1-methylphosphonate 5-triphosphate synthase subunit PhnG
MVGWFLLRMAMDGDRVCGAGAPAERARWMGVLARASRATLEAFWAGLPTPPRLAALKPPETGLVMLRGRAGGDGAAFNLGEMTVTRCVLRAPDGTLGFGYVAGRDRRHAELAAAFDALLQMPAHADTLRAALIAPLAAAQAEAQARNWHDAARTRVEFFTLARDA